MKHKKLYLYTVDSNYVNYLASFTPHLYKEKEDKRSRKYIGIVLLVNGFSYFAPLTSYKKKHSRFATSIDFIKIGKVAAININKMFPVPKGLYREVVIIEEKDSFYRQLLYREQRFIQNDAELICNNAKVIYDKVLQNPESKLAKRSNDFKLLEKACEKYIGDLH